jgi:two-component system C4-dicarboxylate transport sensor histidine kinase DctB
VLFVDDDQALRVANAQTLELAGLSVKAHAGAEDALTGLTRDFDGVIVEIDDNGPGIPAAIADQLFTPFVTGRPDGLGLGLGIARDIAREFGGDLDLARSALGGTAFRIVLRRA